MNHVTKLRQLASGVDQNFKLDFPDAKTLRAAADYIESLGQADGIDKPETVPDDALRYIDPTDHDRVDAFMVPEANNSESHFRARIYVVTQYYYQTGMDSPKIPVEWEDLGVIYLKWDGCCHLGVGDRDMGDVWVHLCGPFFFERLFRILRWAWQTAQDQINHYEEDQRVGDAP